MIIMGEALPQSQFDAENSACFIAKVANATIGYAIGDKIVKVAYHDTITGAVTYTWLNVTQETVLASAPVMTEVKACDDKVDVELINAFHTDLTTGEITPVVYHVFYDGDGNEVTRILTDADSNVVFTVTGVVESSPIRVPIGAQVIAYDDTAPVVLTVPAFTAGAHIQVHKGVDAKVSVSGAAPVPGFNGAGNLVKQGREIILHSAMEILQFQIIGFDGSAPGEIYVEYFNTSIETGV